MKVFISSNCLIEKNLNVILSFCLKNKINLELTAGLFNVNDNKIRASKVNCTTISYLIHNYFPPPETPFVLNLASVQPEILHSSLQLCRSAIRLSASLKAPFYSVHAGFALNLTPDDLGNPASQLKRATEGVCREAALEVFATSIKELSQYADEYGIDLLIENNVTSVENLDANGNSSLLLSRPDEIQHFFDQMQISNLGLLLDVGHAKVSAKSFNIKPEQFFTQLNSYIKALHLSDNNGLRDTNTKFSIDSWFVPYLKHHSNKPMVIEVYNLQTNELAEQHQLLNELTK